MKRDDILILEKQINILEKESKILEDAFNKKDLKKFNEAKQNMFRAQSKIRRVVK